MSAADKWAELCRQWRPGISDAEVRQLLGDAPADPCHWTEEGDSTWRTDCGHVFAMDGGEPQEHGMRWCCYCGKTLRQVLASDSELVSLEDVPQLQDVVVRVTTGPRPGDGNPGPDGIVDSRPGRHLFKPMRAGCSLGPCLAVMACRYPENC